MRTSSLIFLAAAIGLVSSFAPADDAGPPAKVDVSAAMAATSGLNEMRGKLESKSNDPKAIRITVDGGFNVEFSYDARTTMINGGSPITLSDLNYGDELIVRYAGKELKAVVVDRVSKAPKPQ
jgi:hypothetical protein